MNIRNAFIVATSLCLLSACEKIDLEKEEGGNDDVVHTVPTRTGEGTQEAPYTVGQVINGGLDHKVHWFIGYVVGTTYQSMKNAIFEEESRYDSNILISDNPECENIDECIPVELNTAALKKAFSLNYNSHLFRQCILLQGRFSLYFRTNGIRDIEGGYWLPEFNYLSIIPTEWEETEEEY